jgi:hypothetical protein
MNRGWLAVCRGKEQVASCKYAEDAAAIVAASPDDTTVHYRNMVVWREGSLIGPIASVAAVIKQRCREGKVSEQ